MGTITTTTTTTTTIGGTPRSGKCPGGHCHCNNAHDCCLTSLWVLTVIAGLLVILAGIVGFWEVDPSRAWIFYFTQIILGLILLGNEIPISFIVHHLPTLSSYEFKGFFLIFVATYMFGSGGTWRDNHPDANRSFWDNIWSKGFLIDLCSLVMIIKGIFCLLLWVGKTSICPNCLAVEAAHIAGEVTAAHVEKHLTHAQVGDDDGMKCKQDCHQKCPECCTVGCNVRFFTAAAGIITIAAGIVGIIDAPFGRIIIILAYQILFGVILLGVEFNLPVISAFVTRHMPTLRAGWDSKGYFCILVSGYTLGSGGFWRNDATFMGFFVDCCGVVLLTKGIICLMIHFGIGKCCPNMIRRNFQAAAGKHVISAAPIMAMERC